MTIDKKDASKMLLLLLILSTIKVYAQINIFIEFETFQTIIILLLYTFFFQKNKFALDESHYCLTRFF